VEKRRVKKKLDGKGARPERLRQAATSVGCHCNTTLSQVWVTDKIRNPQCAFEMSMFMCPAVHMSARILQRPSSTHEPSDPPFRVVSLRFSSPAPGRPSTHVSLSQPKLGGCKKNLCLPHPKNQRNPRARLAKGCCVFFLATEEGPHAG
jgi:hypothetical protein